MRKLFVVLLGLALLAGLEQANGQTGGIVITPIGMYDSPSQDCFVDAVGRIVVVGRAITYTGQPGYRFAVARYTPAGALDPTFGTGGVVTTVFKSGPAAARGAAAYPGGRIVLGGWANVNLKGGAGVQTDFALARYNTNGSLDGTFRGGKSDNPGTVTSNVWGSDAIENVVVQGDGKILAIGRGDNATTLARYTTTGGLDTTFNSTGVLRMIPWVGVGFGRHRVALWEPPAGDRKIVVVGWPVGGGDYSKVLRYNSDGSPDTTFGEDINGDGSPDGVVRSDRDFTGFCASTVTVDGTGNIFVGGNVYIGGGAYRFAVAKYFPTGDLDTSFNAGSDSPGLAKADNPRTSGAICGLAIQADGKIVAAGEGFDAASGSAWSPGVARFNADGTLDTSFGEDLAHDGTRDGVVVTPFSGRANSVAIQPADGKIVVSVESAAGFVLIRYNPNGALDESFGQ